MNAHMSGLNELNQEGGGGRAEQSRAGRKSAFSSCPNNRISGHEDRIKQGQTMHGTADLGLGVRCRRGFGGYSLGSGARFRTFLRISIDVGDQHLNRTPK